MLTMPLVHLYPVSGNRLDRLELLLESKLSHPVQLQLGVRAAPHVWDFRSTQDLAELSVTIPANHNGWIGFPLQASLDPERLYYIYTSAQRGIFWGQYKEVDGQPNRCPVAASPADLPGATRWRPLTNGYSFCLRLTPESRPYSPGNVIRGTNRPDRWSNIWISDPTRELPAWIELQWPSARQLNTIQLTFDTDANRRLTLPLFRYPDCVRDYRLECWSEGAWQSIVEVKGNYVRRRVHRFEAVQSDRVRLTVLATNGAPSARVYEMRVYREA